MLTLLLALVPDVQAQQGRDEFGVTLSTSAGWLWMDGDENLNDTWSLAPRLGYNLTQRFIIEASCPYHQGVTRAFGYRYDAITPRVELMVDLAPAARVEPFLAGGYGVFYKKVNRDPSTWEDEPLPDEDFGNYKNPDTDNLVSLGGGVFIPLAGAMSLRVDARYLYTFGTEPHGEIADSFGDAELTVGFIFRAADRNLDRDLDNILDKVDPCPDEPEDWDGFEDTGCPDPDNDEDGILDRKDECPDDGEDFDEWKDRDGCPEDDNDKDGLLDDDDKCPNDAEDRDGFRDKDGCPDDDNDGDTILDLSDQCPNHPEDMDGTADDDGCVDPDNDSDGIADVVDTCRDVPEVYNGFDDTDGCPDDIPEEVKKYTGVIRGINFEYNSATITVDSYHILDDAAAVLIQYPDMRIEVQGHTDSDGSDDYNFDLSDRRAESVVRYLIGRGVAPERLTWMGYGESVPLVPNDSEAAKAVNRRVEFKLIQVEQPGSGTFELPPPPEGFEAPVEGQGAPVEEPEPEPRVAPPEPQGSQDDEDFRLDDEDLQDILGD